MDNEDEDEDVDEDVDNINSIDDFSASKVTAVANNDDILAANGHAVANDAEINDDEYSAAQIFHLRHNTIPVILAMAIGVKDIVTKQPLVDLTVEPLLFKKIRPSKSKALEG